MKDKIPIMYLYIHSKVIEKFVVGIVNRKNVFIFLSRQFRIKKIYQHPILKELMDYKLIIKHNNSEINIMKLTFDLTNTNKIYKLVGLY